MRASRNPISGAPPWRSNVFSFLAPAGISSPPRSTCPTPPPRAFALFAHCFTCSKDNLAARRIAAGLAARGIAVLRFDFTGLGNSEGEFANATFSSNVADLVLAADHLRKLHRAPSLLIGHSLGGAAVLAAAAQIPEAKAVATIAAPSDPSHVVGLFAEHIDAIRAQGSVEVSLAGRPFTIKRAFLDDASEHNLTAQIAKLHRALLVMHAPADTTVGIDNATKIFIAAKHPKSFVSLDGADHLLSNRRDASYAADVIAAWAERYIEAELPPATTGAPEVPRNVIVQETGDGTFQQRISVGPHRLLADEPVAVGGADSGPSPYDLLLSALGACTSMTMRLYAERKKLPLDRVTVTLSHAKVHAEDCTDCETKVGLLDRIERVIAIDGDLDAEQRSKLLEIADKCPVHRTLTSDVKIVTRAAD